MSATPASRGPDEDELSAEEMRESRAKHLRRRLIAAAGVALLALAIVITVALPMVKNWRARQFAERAEELRAAGQLQEAFNNAASALQMRPGLAEVKRTYARVLLAANEPAGLQLMQQLVDSGEGTASDLLESAEAALRFGEIPLAEKQTFQLLQGGESTPEALHLLARVRLAQQRIPDAVQALRESIEAGGGAKPAILLAQLLAAANAPDSLASAVELLRPIARQPDENGLEALLVLLSTPALGGEEGPGWIDALRNHPLATDTQKLAAASAELQRQPTDRASVIRRTTESYRDGTVEQKSELARWLNQNGEHEAALEVLSAEEASTRSDLFLIRLDAMAGNKDWTGLAELLQGDEVPLSKAVVLLYRGRAARELGKAEESATFFRRAIVEAAPTPDMLWYIINYLQRIGENALLEQELSELTENPAYARQAFAALVPIVQKRRDAEELYKIYDRMLQRLPEDNVIQNDHHYFAALTGRPPDVIGGQELVAEEPRMLAFRITLALAQLKSGQPQAAMKIFDGITLDPTKIQPYQRAVLAAVLGANGRESEARQLAKSVERDVVTVQEYELIAPWREESAD